MGRLLIILFMILSAGCGEESNNVQQTCFVDDMGFQTTINCTDGTSITVFNNDSCLLKGE